MEAKEQLTYISESDEEISQRNTRFTLYENDNNSKWTSRMKIIAIAAVLVYFNLFGIFALVIPYFPNVVSEV